MTSGVTSASSGSLVYPEPRPGASLNHTASNLSQTIALSSNSKCGNTDFGSLIHIVATKLEDKSVEALLSDSKALYLYH